MTPFVFVAVMCFGAVSASLSDLKNDFKEFKIRFGRTYGDLEEETYRFGVFVNNSLLIQKHNQEAVVMSSRHPYLLGMNQFGDMTSGEFRKVMSGLTGVSRKSHGEPFHYDIEAPLPSDVDWRTKGAVTPVKNQKECGSCWAFSATGSLEGQHYLKDGKLVSLSEQNLVDCSKKFGNFGCGGGLMENAFRYIKANDGIDTERSYPYTAMDGKCVFKRGDVGATDSGYVAIPPGSEAALKAAVAKIGPISVGMDASGSAFQLYKSGIYCDPSCSSTALDHGVLAVGYGAGEPDGKYWLIKNSWGTTWGEKGYFKLCRDHDNKCGVATQASYPKE